MECSESLPIYVEYVGKFIEESRADFSYDMYMEALSAILFTLDATHCENHYIPENECPIYHPALNETFADQDSQCISELQELADLSRYYFDRRVAANKIAVAHFERMLELQDQIENFSLSYNPEIYILSVIEYAVAGALEQAPKWPKEVEDLWNRPLDNVEDLGEAFVGLMTWRISQGLGEFTPAVPKPEFADANTCQGDASNLA